MTDRYVNKAQQRILTCLLALVGHEVVGMTPSEVAQACRSSASNATRDLRNLQHAGLAEQLETGRWRLTPRFPQCALTVLAALEKAEDHLEETRQRFTRTR